MIVYSATKEDFCQDVILNRIEIKIDEAVQKNLGRRTPINEINSWKNSMMYMHNILSDNEIPIDAWISIEYKIPQTSKRIDFILTGKNQQKKDTVVIIELKQWQEATRTDKDGIIISYVGKAERELPHPSYQAWTYASLIEDYNFYVQENNINIIPCAYIHNSNMHESLCHVFYKEYLDKAPLFLRDDVEKLKNFIKKHVKYGDKNDLIYKIDQGKIRPSKSLAEKLSSMLQGNKEFLMIDDQKVVFETALSLAKTSSVKNKNVLIVEGGPGSGKTVVAINLLVQLTQEQLTCKYVTKNAAPRAVYEKKLTGSFKKSHISNLFVGSGAFTEVEPNTFNTLIVDEAHRLNAKSGMFSNLGENQVGEIILSSHFSIFFIDEDQKVTFKDIGTSDEIVKWAKKQNAHIHKLKLSSQFRCNGSDGYMAWLDYILQIKETANEKIFDMDYEFKVFDNPQEMKEAIIQKNKINNKSRVVAGYCWDWISRENKELYDINIGNFKIKWNLSEHGSSWIIHEESINEAGCIHTCQGLELDYVGVIIGPDLIARDDKVITDGMKRARTDQSIKGFKKMLKENEMQALKLVDQIIRNTYRTLMTRGMKGCYIYCTDKETSEYFRKQLKV
ncbi:MAG: DUF2075 domain-containing protein [Bacteriovoracaceae bacterium]|nr:DUF2075 domain-containing protein [Bacteriovoracaceae bacterium]